jgi:xanthine dehydrogenase accessory factor
MEPFSTVQNESKIILEGYELQDAGENVLLATVVKTWGSSPRPTGAVMVLTESGMMRGSVSGGCIEDELALRVRQTFPSTMEQVDYSSDTSRTLPCGGTLSLVLEPLDSLQNKKELIEYLSSGKGVTRKIDLAKNMSSWSPSKDGDKTVYQNQNVQIVYEEPWRILIIGMGELAQCVYQQAQLLGYAIEVCDPRQDYQSSWPFTDSNISEAYPDDFLREQKLDEHTAIVALTHDPKIDDMAIMEALESRAFYVGALGSVRTTTNRKHRLIKHFDFKEDQLNKLRAPIGVDINSRRPQEIALSILMQITAERNAVILTSERLS